MGVEGPEDFPEPPRLRQLRWLVNALTATLIVGVSVVLIIVGMLFSRGADVTGSKRG